MIGRLNEELQLCQEQGINYTRLGEQDYPEALRALKDPPPILYYVGDLQLLHQGRGLSVVGSRSMSQYGKNLMRQCFRYLQDHDLNIISGLADGVDSEAHILALRHELPTVAVLGAGIMAGTPDWQAYTQGRQTNLKHKLLAHPQALVLSELPPSTKAQTWTFPRRNRIIAALSPATLVIEARRKSGSLITANDALKLERDVILPVADMGRQSFAGSLDFLAEHYNQANVHALYKPQQLSALMQDLGYAPRLRLQAQNPRGNLLLDILEESKSYEEILLSSDLPEQALATQLTMLEIQGLIKKQAGSRWIKN